MIFTALLWALAAGPAPTDARKAETAAAMHSALHALMAVQPYLASPAAFRDPANQPAITADLDALGAVAHRFATPGKQDPTVEVLAGVFGAEVARARRELAAGQTEATRARLQGLSTLCFACHGRERTADFADAAQVVERLALPPLRRAELFATTRQFDRALEVWAQALAVPPTSEAIAFEQAAAVRQALVVTVGVKADRPATTALLAKQVAMRGVPPFVRRSYVRWLEDAKAWEADPFDPLKASPADRLARARGLLEAAGLLRSAVPDEDALIPALRASALLHEALEQAAAAPWRGEALYLLGVATATTAPPALWELDGLYLEACVRQQPHSEIARTCANRNAERLRVGWTGSGGTRIPPDLARRQTDLEDLAR